MIFKTKKGRKTVGEFLGVGGQRATKIVRLVNKSYKKMKAKNLGVYDFIDQTITMTEPRNKAEIALVLYLVGVNVGHKIGVLQLLELFKKRTNE